MKKIILIAIILVNIIFSQQETVSEAIKYYPLHIGDFWEYKVVRTGDAPNENWIEYKSIIGDTILSNHKYFIVKTDTNSNLGIHTSYLRIDSSNGNVYKYDYNYPEILFDSLNIEPSDSIAYECKMLSDIYSKNVFGENVSIRFYEYVCVTYENLQYDYELAKGFGEIHKNYSYSPVAEPIVLEYTLVYAKIDGIEYGIKTNIITGPPLKEEFILRQNYPNPFNPSTKIDFNLPEQSFINLSVYDVLGNKILTLIEGVKNKGYYSINFNGSKYSSGIYYYTLKIGESRKSRKMLLLK